jgi:hypothetical protein
MGHKDTELDEVSIRSKGLNSVDVVVEFGGWFGSLEVIDD